MKNFNKYFTNTQSFVRDIRTMTKYFNCEIHYIYIHIIDFIKYFKKEAREVDDEDTTIMLV